MRRFAMGIVIGALMSVVLAVPSESLGAPTACSMFVRNNSGGTTVTRSCFFEVRPGLIKGYTAYAGTVVRAETAWGDSQLRIWRVDTNRIVAGCSTGSFPAFACATARPSLGIPVGTLLRCELKAHANPGFKIIAFARCASGANV